MAAALPILPDPTGPDQRGRGVRGQYVYWITMVQPEVSTIEAYSLKVPADFSRETFLELVVEASYWPSQDLFMQT